MAFTIWSAAVSTLTFHLRISFPLEKRVQSKANLRHERARGFKLESRCGDSHCFSLVLY